MVPHLSFWASGLALAFVPILHWVVMRRALAVSGRYTALVDRLRFGKPEAVSDDAAALIAALRAETVASFGEGAVTDVSPQTQAENMPSLSQALRPQESSSSHAAFLGGLALGGLLSVVLAGALEPTLGLRGELFARTLSALGLPAPLLLGLGGVLVGFGTRMAGGCTSGHGLCGLSQMQPGSLLATMAFFGAGVVTSFALGALS